MLPWLTLAALAFAANPLRAQSGTCVTANLLRVDAAFSRAGPGGTFDHSIQVSNLSHRPVTFRVGFRMSNVQVNQASLGQAFTLPVRGNRIIILGNGRQISTANRIGGGVTLTC